MIHNVEKNHLLLISRSLDSSGFTSCGIGSKMQQNFGVADHHVHATSSVFLAC